MDESVRAGSAPTNESDELRRMQRHLRALSAVNRHLYAQLEGGGQAARNPEDLLTTSEAQSAPVKVRRASVGRVWLEQLQLIGGSQPAFLVRTPKSGVHVVEGSIRRVVRSSLVSDALSRVLGPIRNASESEFARWNEGPPVEVMEAASGPPFIVVGGKRRALRGLPMPYPVSTEQMLVFPSGDDIRVGAFSVRSEVRRTLGRAKRLAKRTIRR